MATGPVLVRFDEAAKGPVALDAVYFLDYKGGGCWRPCPATGKRPRRRDLIEPFSERDLVADFKLDLDTGPRPRFLMTTGSIGPDNAGWAPLYVFETTTSQLAVYRMLMQTTIGTASRPRFELLELRSYAKAGRSQSPSVTIAVRCHESLGAMPERGASVGQAAAVGAAAGLRRRRAAAPPPPRRPASAVSTMSVAVRPCVLMLDQPFARGSKTFTGVRTPFRTPYVPNGSGWPAPSLVKTAPVSYWKNPSH